MRFEFRVVLSQRGSVDDQQRITITDAEVLAICGGVDDTTGQEPMAVRLRVVVALG